MAMFTSFGRRRSLSADDATGRELTEDLRRSLPPRYEAVGEALVSAADTTPACAVVGRDAARDGAALGEALTGLRTTFELVLGVEPDFASVEALSVAWSEATLEFLHTLSCEDPLTGLASLAHLRTRLDELYREADGTGEPVSASHALVVVQIAVADDRPHAGHRFTRALHMVQVAHTVRAVFFGGETVARLGARRAAIVVRRRGSLGGSVTMVRELLGDLGPELTTRVWIEGLPQTPDAAARVLDELAR